MESRSISARIDQAVYSSGCKSHSCSVRDSYAEAAVAAGLRLPD